MKRILIATAAFALIGGSAALAQPQGGDEHHRNEGERGGQQGGQQGHYQPQEQGRPQQYQGQPNRGGPQGQPQYQGRGPYQGQQQYQGQAYRNQPYQGQQQYYGRQGYPQQGQGRYYPQGQGQNWRGGQDRADHRDWGRYQRNFYAQRRFNFGAYERPQGWYYRRWRFGEFLPGVFWSQNYWIGDYGYFGLPYPPPGCVWVRYGSDALLIDRYTGEIVQVVYGIFY